MNIADLVYKTLEDVPNVFQSWYRKDLEDTHVIFQQTSEQPADYEDNEYSIIEHYVQVDVFGQDEQEAYTTKELVKEKMEANGFDWMGTQYECLEEINYYHIGHKFKYTEEL